MLAIYPYGVPVSRVPFKRYRQVRPWPIRIAAHVLPWRGQRKHRYRSGMRDDGRSGEDAASAHARGPRVLLLLGRLPRQIHRRSGKISCANAEAAPAAPPGTIYTCPMHPQIRQVGPGSCPICGMALEPVSATAEAGSECRTDRHDAPLLDRRGTGGTARRPGDGRAFSRPQPSSLHFAANIGLGSICARNAGGAVGRMAVLRARLGVGPQSLAQHVQPDRARHRGRLRLQPCRHVRAGALSGELARPTVSSRSISKRQRSSRCSSCSGKCSNCARASRPAAPFARCSILHPKPRGGSRDDGSDEEVPLEQVHIGDRLRVRPGDSVPVDGVVIEGRSAVDESMVTGESMPVEKEKGAKVIGGTINGTGSLVMRAEKIGADTMLARIVQMVAEAQRSRAPIQRLADIVSAWFVPAVIVVAVVAFIAWMIWGRRPPSPMRWSRRSRF